MFKTSLYNNGNRDNSFPKEFKYTTDVVRQIKRRNMELTSMLGNEVKYQNDAGDVLYVTIPAG